MSAHPWTLPAEDRRLSPYTGWTRAHWEAVADGLLAAVAPHATPGRALYHLPGPRPGASGRRSDGLEGFARTFLLAALRVAGAGGEDPGGLLERYAAGLRAGTRSPGADGTEDWPLVTDRSQPLVEAASVALALHLTRPWLWDRLADGDRQRAAAWLSAALTAEPCDNNWVLFPAAVGGFLAGAGYGTAAADRAVGEGLRRIEPWYRGEGWYSDGPLPHLDHYNAWALHLYPMLHAWLSGDTAVAARHGPRLHAFLSGYARFFGGDGAPLHQGRSLTYRMAAAAPLWLGALTGHTPLSPGTTRRLASGALRYFLDRGAARGTGLLSLGWHGPFPPVLQVYSGPGSPYWASKGFLGLLLPPGDPVWTAAEEPAPAERADAVTALPACTWLMQSTAADGIVRLHNHGSEDPRYDPHYTRLAYSTATGPVPDTTAPDNHFGLLIGGGPTARTGLEPLGTGEDWAASAHRAGGARVVTAVLARGAAEVRLHLVTGAAPETEVRHTGWAAGESMSTELHPVHGYTGTRPLPPAATAFTPRAGVPALTGHTGPGGAGALFVCLARLTAETGPPPLPSLARITVRAPAPRGEEPVPGAEATVEWTGGPARHVRLTPDSVTVT